MSDFVLWPEISKTEQQVLNKLFSFNNGVAGGLSLTDDTAGVALDADTACKYVDLTCRAGIMAIGFSTGINAEAANAKGLIVTPGSTVVRIYASNLNQVFVSGATGTRASYVYFTD